ncbi:MAG: two-component regulator propeller domain-containing protein, partial [Anaerolineales bacterium]
MLQPPIMDRRRFQRACAKHLLVLLVVMISACAAPGGDQVDDQISGRNPSVEFPYEDRTAPATNDISRMEPGTEIAFERISLDQGLSQSTVTAITQDQHGFMWFGTADGLNRFDGYRFITYRHIPADEQSLSNNQVTSLLVDGEGSLWVGTLDGLSRYLPDQQAFRTYRNVPDDRSSLSGDHVLAIYEDSAGTVWVGTDDGLNAYDPESDAFTVYQHDDNRGESLVNNRVQSIVEDRAGALWIGTFDGLDEFDRDSNTFSHFQFDPIDRFSLTNSNIQSLIIDTQGILWIGTQGGGLNRWIPEFRQFENYQYNSTLPQSLSDNRIWSMFEDPAGVLWIGTERGLNAFDTNREVFQRYLNNPLDPNSLSNNTVYSIFEDRSGVLWIGTESAGLNKHDVFSKRFTHIRNDPNDPFGLPDNNIHSLFADQDGTIWIGSERGLTGMQLRTRRFLQYRHDPVNPFSLSSNLVTAILRDRDGILWVGTTDGLNRLDDRISTFTRYAPRPSGASSISASGINVLYEDHDGNLWIGTENGLNRHDATLDRFIRYYPAGSDEEQPGNQISTLLEDSHGTLWVGTHGGGLFQFDRVQELFFRNFTLDLQDPGSLSSDNVTSVLESSDGTLWVGTMQGLNRLDRPTGTFSKYYESDGLPNDVIHALLEDQLGRIWISTNQGLARFDPDTGIFRSFTPRDGVQSYEFNSASATSPDGRLIFGGVNGFNLFDPLQITDNLYVPEIVMTSLSQAGEVLDLEQAIADVHAISLHWPDNFFEFEFSGLHYAQPENNEYAYFLDGFDRDWNLIGNRRFGRYTNLPAGSYTLYLKAANYDGLWNSSAASLDVTVVPPFWATRAFQIVLAGFLLLAAFAGYRLRIRSVEARSRELEQEVEQRTHEIERRTKELEALYHADEEMLRHLDLDEVLQAIVDVAVEYLGADKSSVFTYAEAGDGLKMRVARGFNTETIRHVSLPTNTDLTRPALEESKPVIVWDATSDPRLRAEPAATTQTLHNEGIGSYMQMPIQVDEKVFALFNICYTNPYAFGQEQIRLFASLAQRAALAIENAQLYERTQEIAALEERNRLARDLHDAVTQTLFSASLIAETLPNLWETNPDEVQTLLTELRQLSRGALAEMRTLLLELRPATLVEAGLQDLLTQLAAAVTGRKGIPVHVEIQGDYDLPQDAH